MIESDTIKLLRECDAGIKMGTDAIDEVYDSVKNEDFKGLLNACKDRHITLKREINSLLDEYHDDGKDPNPIAKGMSHMKTEMKLTFSGSDESIASLITDGCNMGVKSLNMYLNKYEAADEKSKDITKRLIAIEEHLTSDIRKYL